MAKSYYGYVKRDVENETNWAAITKSMNDMLSAEGKRRETKKADIDKASREFGEVLTNAEGSSHQGLSDFWLDGANSIQETRRMQDQLLKSGKLKYKDYISQRQNITDGSNELIGLVKGFNAKWEAVKNDPNASEFDYANLANVQGFADFTNYRTWANPTDGRISLGKRVLNEETGQYELSSNPNDFRQISSLKNRMQQRAPKFQIDKFTKDVAAKMGKFVKAKMIGGAATVSDVTAKPEYQKQLDNWVESAMIDDFNAGSMGTDAFGIFKYNHDEKYRDQALADKEGVIFIGLDTLQKGAGMVKPIPTKAQKSKIKELLIERIESQTDYIETAAPRFRPPNPSYTESKDMKLATQQGEALAKTWYGNVKQIEEGINFIKSLTGNQDIVEYDIQPDQIILTKIDTDGRTKRKGRRYPLPPIPRGDDFEAYITSIASELGAKGSDLDAVVKAAMKSLPKDSEGNPLKRNIDFGKDEQGTKKSGYKYEIAKQQGLTSKFTDYVSGKLKIDKSNSVVTAQNLQTSLEALGTGIEVTSSSNFFGKEIKIAITPKISRKFDILKGNVKEDIEAFLRNNIGEFDESLKISEDKIDEFLNELDSQDTPPKKVSTPPKKGSKPRGYTKDPT